MFSLQQTRLISHSGRNARWRDFHGASDVFGGILAL
jgi:hypothetical protein